MRLHNMRHLGKYWRTMTTVSGRSASTMNSEPKAIEVELKFLFSKENKEKVLALGAELLQKKRIHDVYYDTEDYQLTLNDRWLRLRDNRWELKCPPAESVSNFGNCSRQYAEYEDPVQITDKLGAFFADTIRTTTTLENGDIPGLLLAAQCREFASFCSERESYRIASEGVRLDLDMADFGYNLGELEILVKDQDQAASAAKKIDDLAKRIGVYSESRVPGKVVAYLKQRNPHHFQKLVERFGT